jgi:hypothetical protein
MRSISTAFCVFGQAGLYVHLSVMQSSKDQLLLQQKAHLLSPPDAQDRFTAERVL